MRIYYSIYYFGLAILPGQVSDIFIRNLVKHRGFGLDGLQPATLKYLHGLGWFARYSASTGQMVGQHSARPPLGPAGEVYAT